MPRTPTIQVRDRDGLLAKLEALVDEIQAKHPGRTTTKTTVARELLEAALGSRAVRAQVLR
jgi:hypothetical protein